jgi:hypothetical protein
MRRASQRRFEKSPAQASAVGVRDREPVAECAPAGSAAGRVHELAPGSRNSIVTLQRRAGNRAVTEMLHTAPEPVLRALNSSNGERLPSYLENAFSRKFGRDLSHVTVHRDATASAAARGIGANAFAHGGDVYFREGMFRPGSASGRVLLAHELAHVVQQTRSGGAPQSSRGAVEAHAEDAAQSHANGSSTLNAGPSAPVGVAADNGVAYEDEELQASVLATRDEALDTILGAEDEAQKTKAASGVTDVRTGHLEDQARTLREKLAPEPAKTGRIGKNQKTPSPPMPVSSPDLRDASEDEIRAHRRSLLETQLAAKNPKDQEVLARDIDNTTGAIDYAHHTFNVVIDGFQKFGLREHQAAAFLQHLIPAMQDDVQGLQDDVYKAHKLRSETSSWVTGPVHFWGGAWNEIEASDFAQMNRLRGEAADLMQRGRIDEAISLLRDSWYEYRSLRERFGDYQEGIQKGGARMVKLFSTTEKIARGTLNVVNPLAGAAYSFGQDSFQQEEMVRRGLQDKIDWLGNAKGAAWGAVVGKVTGGASRYAGTATAPFLGGFGSTATSFATGVGVSSAMTGTNPADVFTDPTNLAVMLISHGYKPGGGSTGGAPEPGASGSLPEAPAVVPEVPAAGPAPAPESGQVSEMAVAAAETPAPVVDNPVSVADTPAPAADTAPVTKTEAPPVAEKAPAPKKKTPARRKRAKSKDGPQLDPRDADIAETYLETIGEKRKMAAGGGLVDPDFKPGPATKPPSAMRRGERTPGRSQVSQRAQQSQRNLARKRFGKIMQEALLNEGEHTALTQLSNEHLSYSQRARIIRTGTLPRNFPFHHFLSVADFPEFAGLAEAGAALPEDVHLQAAHAGDTRRPVEAATFLAPGAEEAVPFNDDPLAKKYARGPAEPSPEEYARTTSEETLRQLLERQQGRDTAYLRQQIAALQRFLAQLDPDQ